MRYMEPCLSFASSHKVVRVENASVEPSLTAGAFFCSEAGYIIPSAETTVIPVGGFNVGLARQGCRFRRLTRASTTLSFCGERNPTFCMYSTILLAWTVTFFFNFMVSLCGGKRIRRSNRLISMPAIDILTGNCQWQRVSCGGHLETWGFQQLE